MKVLFLDIDGVLNTKHTKNPRKLPYVVERKLVKRLRKLVETTKSKVVLVSTWRYDPAGLFSAKRYEIPFIDCTPDLPQRPRRDEILRWLKQHPRVTRYAVLDDDDDELDELPLFQPKPSEGLTPELVRAAAAYLKGLTNDDSRRNTFVRLAKNIANITTGHKG